MPLYRVEFKVKLEDGEERWQQEKLKELEEDLKATVYFLFGVQLKTGIQFTRTKSLPRRGTVRRVDA